MIVSGFVNGNKIGSNEQITVDSGAGYDAFISVLRRINGRTDKNSFDSADVENVRDAGAHHQ